MATPRTCPAHFGITDADCRHECTEFCVRADPTRANRALSAALRERDEAYETAARVAEMHGGDCAHFGDPEKARTASTIADMIRALKSPEPPKAPAPDHSELVNKDE